MDTRTTGAGKQAGEHPESLSLIVGLAAVVFSGLTSPERMPLRYDA